MQMMFFRQHFGNLAIGLSNTGDIRRQKISRMEERDEVWERQKFFEVDDGGVSHPWAKEDEVRVAITGDRLVFYPERPDAPEPRVFAKVEFQMTGEVYLAYRNPHSAISYGLPDPVDMAGEILRTAYDYVNGENIHGEGRWVAVNKPQVPVHHRSLLGKVMVRLQGAVSQGRDFFQDPKSK